MDYVLKNGYFAIVLNLGRSGVKRVVRHSLAISVQRVLHETVVSGAAVE